MTAADFDSKRAVVLDASFVLSMLLKEPAGPAVKLALRRWSEEDRRLLTCNHFWLEVTNALVRRPEFLGQHMTEAIYEVDLLRLEDVAIDRGALLLTLDNAERYGLTTYNAAYLTLAQVMNADLATLDRRLAAAARDRAIALDDAHGLAETSAVYERDVTWPSYKGASAYLAKLRAEVLAERA